MKKLEAKKLAAEEDASLSSKPTKAKSNLAPKVTITYFNFIDLYVKVLKSP